MHAAVVGRCSASAMPRRRDECLLAETISPCCPRLDGVQVANMVSRDLEKQCIVVFDEAHNIDNVCIEVRLPVHWCCSSVAQLLSRTP